MWEVTAPSGPGRANAITDVPGVLVGHHQRTDEGWLTGCTVVLTVGGATAAVDVRGGGPGTRETDLLQPGKLVEQVHGVLLTGGSAFGLDAATGVAHWLEAHGKGYAIGEVPGHVVPIVPAAVLFDLTRGAWGNRPDAAFGRAACEGASDAPPAQGTVGAGTGAQCGPLKGGVGTASVMLDNGVTVGALLAVNARGHASDPTTGEVFGASAGLPGEFAWLRAPDSAEAAAGRERLQATRKMARLNTTIGVVATDADLTKAEAHALAVMAQAGLPRALRPVHTLFDGDALFALATGKCPLDGVAATDGYAVAASRPAVVCDLGAAAADCVTRAIVHALLAATAVGDLPAYLDVYPSARTPGAP